MNRLLALFTLFFGLANSGPTTAQPAEIMVAARAGDLEEVRTLLEMGADPDPPGIATPLYFAAQGGHTEIVGLLLESGADPNALSKWGTPLHIAARRGHIDIAKVLLQHGANPNATGGELANSPLHEAASGRSTEIGRLLIEHGAEVNARNKEFEPPIHLALERGPSEIAELLRRAGASPIDIDPISNALAKADIEAGRIKALECGVCHQLSRDGPNTGSGPRLWDIVGRPIASETFDYTDALRSETGTWTYERLNSFLADPAGTVPGSGMYRGYVAAEADRVNLIAYLRTLSDAPEPLP